MNSKILASLVLMVFLPSLGWASVDRSVRVAVCQILVIDGDRDGNFRRIENALELAEAKGAELAVFPESSLLGWENPDAYRLATPIPGQDSDRLAKMARQHHIMLAIGLDEKDGEKLYDSALLIDSDGKILWKYRKINVLPELMTPPYSTGRMEDIGVVATRFGRIGVLICADTFTDAHLHRLKALSPDLLLTPYGWAAPKADWPQHAKVLEELVLKRAQEIGAPMVGVNLVGEMTHGPWRGYTYGGSSFVADRSGRILLTLRDRDTDLQIIDLPVGRSVAPSP